MHGPGLVIGGSQGIGEGMVGAPDTATPLKLGASAFISSGATDVTTNRLTLPAGKTFQAGLASDDTNPLPSIDPGTDTFIEVVFSIDPSNAPNGKIYEFFICDGDTVLDSYTVTPQWTIGSLSSYDHRKSSFFFQ